MREFLDVGGCGPAARGGFRERRARRGVVQRGLGGDGARLGANGACPRGGAPIAELGAPAMGCPLSVGLLLAEGGSPGAVGRQAERAQ